MKEEFSLESRKLQLFFFFGHINHIRPHKGPDSFNHLQREFIRPGVMSDAQECTVPLNIPAVIIKKLFLIHVIELLASIYAFYHVIELLAILVTIYSNLSVCRDRRPWLHVNAPDSLNVGFMSTEPDLFVEMCTQDQYDLYICTDAGCFSLIARVGGMEHLSSYLGL